MLSCNRCGPCVRAGPELSDLAEKHHGKVAIVGINNESMFRPKDHDVEKVKTFLEENKEAFRYTVYIDTPEGHARDCKFCLPGLLWEKKSRAISKLFCFSSASPLFSGVQGL